MKPLIECVPNFSEGRDLSKVDAIAESMQSVPGVCILDRSSDVDHNRSVFTLAGAPDAVCEGVLRGVGTAAELIDLTKHLGVHPRIGAADVIPFVPLQGLTLSDCVAVARHAAQEIWRRYAIPVYFYEAAALRPQRGNLENIRRGQFEGLREEVAVDLSRAPDVGDARLHPTAGAVAVGARKILIAYNILLDTPDAGVARKIAKAIRFSSGGLPHVKAIGLQLESKGLAQVSINLTDFEQTSLHRVFELVEHEARGRDCKIASSELVGLVPAKAIDPAKVGYLKLDNFSSDSILENRLKRCP